MLTSLSENTQELSLNWLALGLLLAAWNASDDDPATLVRRRPDSLRGYSYVSVRAVSRRPEELGGKFLFKGHKSVNVL